MMRLKLAIGILLIVSFLAGNAQAVKVFTGDESVCDACETTATQAGINTAQNQFIPTNPGDDSGDDVCGGNSMTCK